MSDTEAEPINRLVLTGAEMKCPKCGGTENLSRNEYVACNVNIAVDREGRWYWTGDSEVNWDTSDYQPERGEAEWHCGDCQVDFDAPNIKTAGETHDLPKQEL
jgi:hypothetical protein